MNDVLGFDGTQDDTDTTASVLYIGNDRSSIFYDIIFIRSESVPRTQGVLGVFTRVTRARTRVTRGRVFCYV